MPPRPLALLAAAVVLLAGCSGGPAPGPAGNAAGATRADFAEGTCWTADRLGADPRVVHALARRYAVRYAVAARTVATWPSFSRSVPCTSDHAVEVVKVLRLPALDGRLADYATVLRSATPLARTVARSVAQGCMAGPLASAAALTGLPDAVMEPALPSGATLGWAPAPPDLWRQGRREFACTLTWASPEATRYAAVLTAAFPTARRTCIDNQPLVFVDCARDHDRERIAVIDVREAVAAGAFPGRTAIREGFDGRYLDVGDAAWRRLDAACTAYLHAVSTTRRLTGVANVDVDEWPTPDGSYPVYCDADRPPDQKPLVTRGSVYDRG